MIAVLQRVTQAEVLINGVETRKIGLGLVILLGIEEKDDEDDIAWLSKKIVNMRIFPDENGIMNESIEDHYGDVLLISQFTLHASTKKGNRPSYLKAAKSTKAIPLYEKFGKAISQELKKSIVMGEFGADMKVTLTNDGPVTIIIDSRNRV